MRFFLKSLTVGLLAVGACGVLADDQPRILETWGYSAREPATGKERGRQVYVQWCAICHEAGPGMAGTQGLMRKYRGKVSPLLRERTDLSADYLELVVRNGVASMPLFRKTEVSDGDLEVLTQYLLTAAEEK